MKGYLGEPQRTAEVMHEGWYVTGDIAKFDTDGFITLTDRLSRFAKIAGEMVPLAGVEEAIQTALAADELRCVVTSVSDAARGERLVVLYAGEELDSDAVIAHLTAAGLLNLWIPAREAFHRVEAIPLLGTGKLDLKKIKEMARGLEPQAPEAP